LEVFSAEADTRKGGKMANGGADSAKKEGAMWPFWAIVGFAALLLVVYLASGGGFSPGRAIGRGSKRFIPADQRKVLPKARLRTVSHGNEKMDLASLDGKVIIIHFWATWCGPCKKEYPEFANFVNNNGNEDIVVVPVSLDNSDAAVTSYMNRIHAKFPVYIGAMDFATEVGIRAIPTTVLIDKQGRVAWKQVGAVDWSEKGVPAMARELLDSDD